MKLNLEKIVLGLMLIVFVSCSGDSDTEKYQNKRDKVSNIKSQIKEIPTEDVLIGDIARLHIIDNYLFIQDARSMDKQIHIFNKDDFKYITSIANQGQGPGEITRMGHIEEDKKNHAFLVSDHGKQRIFSYSIDSALTISSYIPEVKAVINKSQFPSVYKLMNDSLSVALIIEPIGVNDFAQSVVKWNINTGNIQALTEKHPSTKKKRVSFAVSEKNELLVECYSYYDLMTIHRLDGSLFLNIYGPNWDKESPQRNPHYRKVAFCGDYILASYSGEEYSPESHIPTKFLVFDLKGNYIKTIETDYRISDFCYDEKNNRIILVLDSEIQFAYLDFDGLIE